MAYTTFNYRTKKALVLAVKAGESVQVAPNRYGFSDGPNDRGIVYLEGPHYPAPHTWYAQATVDVNGVVVKVK